MTKSVVLDSLFTIHNDWRHMGMTLNWEDSAIVQLDAAFGAVNALQEMLFCPQKDALSVLPALPDRLSHGQARGFVFPGGTLDLAWEDDGTVTVTVHARLPLDMSLLLRGEKRAQITLDAGTCRTWSFSPN